MDRRSFCKMAALAAGAIGLGGADAFASVGRRISGARVTVVRRNCFTDLQALSLEDPECGPCEAFTTGQVFELAGECPEGFCPKAWQVLAGCMADAAHCPSSKGENGVIMACCPDGTRPVVFRIEKI